MRSLAKWMQWWFASTIGAAVGVPLGYIVAWIVYLPLSYVMLMLTAFLGAVGLAIGFALVGIVGSAVTGAVIGFIQRSALEEEPQYKGQWVKMAILGWALVGIFTLSAVLPVVRGDLSPLVWLTTLGALMAGSTQWIGLRNRLRQAGWRALIGTLGALSGGLVGIALLGTVSSRGATDPLQRAITFSEFVYKASATGLTNLNGSLVFFVNGEEADQTNWWELWMSDGTPGGTLPVKRAYTGWNEPQITLRTQFNDTLFFSANGVLDQADAQSWRNSGGQWRTDGTSEGTILLESFSSDLIASGGDLYFRAAPQGSPCTLYKVTGSDASPDLIKQLTGTCEGEITASETTLFFLTREAEADPLTCTLWRSDGTAAGTLALRTFEQDIRRYCPSSMLAVNGRLFMIVPTAAEPPELWISDGTQAGTRPVRKLEEATDPMPHYSPIQAGGVYFVVVRDKTETCALWRSDGSPEGTFLLKRTCIFDLTSLDETVLFLAQRPQGGLDLWRSDGRAEGTIVVSDFFPESPDMSKELIGEIAGDLFWRIQDHETCGLWKSHGIQVGMTLVVQLCPSELVSINGTLFFVVPRNEFTLELWRSDGTSSGTTLIRTIP